MSNGGPPAGATQLTDNPSPPAFAPSTVPNQPPKGATQLKASPSELHMLPPLHIEDKSKEGWGTKVARGAALGAFEGMGVKPSTSALGVLGGTVKQAAQGVRDVYDSNRMFGMLGVGAQEAATLVDLFPSMIEGAATTIERGGKQAYKDVQNKDWEAAAEHIASTVTTIATLRASKGAEAPDAALMEKTPVSPSEAAKTLTDAVNPRPQHMPGFEADLGEHLPRAVDYAKRNGFEINTRADLGKALEGVGEESYHDYYEQFIEPTKDEWVATTDIPGYQGETFGEGGHTATIQSLENRLSTINSTLYPKFQKGGLAAEASIDSGTAAQLSSEAAGIRNMMNQTIGQKLGIPPETVANARSKFGAPRDLADKTVRAINEERFGENLERRGADVPSDRAGALRWAIRKLTARKPDTAVANTMKRLKIEREPPPPSPQDHLLLVCQELILW